ncbi:MAG: GWxTD domain-containing protein [Bacteroidota bacterium]|nr:GWxTD domain-containing protein [Bacteroidota bacterium]
MKKLTLAFLLMVSTLTFGQNINVVYDFHTYYSTEGNYAEILTSIDGSSLGAKQTKNKWVKSAELTTIVCNILAPDSALYVDKRIIKSPEVEDSTKISNSSLLDMQRIGLDNGEYIVYFELKDVSTTNQPMQYSDVVKISYPNNAVSISDILILDTVLNTKETNIYTRDNKDMIPNIFNSLPLNKNMLTFYVEIYNADKTLGENTPYALISYLENISSGKKVANSQITKAVTSNSISTYLGQMDVSQLIEGSYYLNIEVRDSKNILHEYKRIAFYKQSEIKPDLNNMEIPADAFVNFIADSLLDDNLACLTPIASSNEQYAIRQAIKHSNNAQKRYLIYEFYKQLNSNHPENTWREYISVVTYVNNKYGTQIKKGYETDMGRVYLLYGAPDNIIDEKFGASSGLQSGNPYLSQSTTPYNAYVDRVDNPYRNSSEAFGVNYYPYQIWVYNKTPFGESNRKFVFYARQDNLIEYFLLHSNAKGENQDMYWENTLSRGGLEPGVEGKAGRQFRVGHE